MLNSSTLVAVCEYSLRRNRMTVLTVTYQGLPDSLHHWRYHQVVLVWCGAALPILTIFVHVTSAPVWLVWILPPAVYHCLPNITRGPIWLCPAREEALPRPRLR